MLPWSQHHESQGIASWPRVTPLPLHPSVMFMQPPSSSAVSAVRLTVGSTIKKCGAVSHANLLKSFITASSPQLQAGRKQGSFVPLFKHTLKWRWAEAPTSEQCSFGGSKPIHYLHAYAEAYANLRSLRGVPTRAQVSFQVPTRMPTRANVEFECRSALWQLQLENRNFSVLADPALRSELQYK